MSPDTPAGQRQRGFLRCETEKIRELLRKQFGADVDLKFYVGGKGRVYAYKDCEFEGRKGIYFGTLEKNGVRLSIEGSFIVGRIAEKNVVEVDDATALKWLRGEDLSVDEGMRGYYILKWGEYFLGCGKAANGVLRNYVPKERRLTKDTNGEGGE
ncbi:MAG: hypothetical protein ABWW66_07155 [Archaeoglobaceae archaeon]